MAKARIMLIEDESIIAMDIHNCLEKLGYEIPALASSGEEAVKIAIEIKPDLILMDIILEGKMDGVEAAEKIHNLIDIPIIYLTAYADDQTLHRAKITEPFGYILKPFEDKELQTAIEMALYKHKMERKLKENEQWLSTTLKSIGDAVITTDKNGNITFMNSAAEALTSWSQEEALGRYISEVFNISGSSEESRYISTFEGGAFASPEDRILISKNNIQRPISDSIAPIKDDRGIIQGAVLVFRDITERKHAEEELRRAHDELELRIQERTAELKSANEDLQAEITDRKAAEEKLKASLEEKEVLLREIHHRVKNNLQIVSSLLYLQSKSATDEAAIEAFKESQNRIKSMALLHEKLYRSSNMAKIDFAEYIKNLVSYLHQSYGASSRKIELKINIDNVLLGIDTAIPCGLIISELVSNSLKHAFPEGASGEIRVELHSVEDNGFKMIISDNGIGLKKDSDSRAGSTLGLQLVNALVKQIDGSLKLDSSHGTTFEIDFRQLKYKERD